MHRAIASNSTSLSPGSSEPQHPSVSVIIAYYMQEHFLAETVESVRRQTYPNFEIIVVDDGSPGWPLPYFRSVTMFLFSGRRIAGARQPETSVFRQSSGEYLVFLDSDDRLTPGADRGSSQGFCRMP